uniref:Uncharacterized protein n=1 Tax=Fagus sylvatica TaxID=28930 RepID=A0A2N9FDY8_FAGSY
MWDFEDSILQEIEVQPTIFLKLKIAKAQSRDRVRLDLGGRAPEWRQSRFEGWNVSLDDLKFKMKKVTVQLKKLLLEEGPAYFPESSRVQL